MNKHARFLGATLGILVLAFALRVYHLDAQSLWWDEIAPLVISRLPFPDWLTPVLQDRGHPPGFYFLLTWITPWGVNEFWVRYLSVCLGTLSVALLARLGKMLGGARVGGVAALLMAVSPFYIWYAQETRMYAPLIFATLASSWAFLELIRQPRAVAALGLFGAAVFGLYAHYLFGVFLVTQLLFLVMARGKHPRALRMWLAATMSAGILFGAWLTLLQVSSVQGRPNLDWIPNAQWHDLALSLYGVLLGASAEPTLWLNWVTPLFGLILAGYGVIRFWNTPAREMLRYLLLWLIVPWLFLFVISMVMPGRALYVDRYLTPFAPALLLLIALGASALYARQRVVCALVAIGALTPLWFSLANMYTLPRYARDDWRGVVAFLAQHMQPREVALVDLSLELPFEFYNTQKLAWAEHPFANDARLDEWFQANAALRTHTAVWLVTTALPINTHRFYPDEAGQRAFAQQDAFRRVMDARYRKLQEWWFPGLMLTKYQVTP